jgi:hypothetical protein
MVWINWLIVQIGNCICKLFTGCSIVESLKDNTSLMVGESEGFTFRDKANKGITVSSSRNNNVSFIDFAFDV